MDLYRSYSDSELVDLLRQGDRLAINEIYKRYQGVLYSHAYGRLSDREDVRDIIQDLFTYLWANRKRLQLSGTFLIIIIFYGVMVISRSTYIK